MGGPDGPGLQETNDPIAMTCAWRIGAGVGTAVGVLIGRWAIAVGISLGVGVGVAIGAAMDSRQGPPMV